MHTLKTVKNLLIIIAVNAFASIFIALVPFVVISILLFFALIPVGIIFGGSAADGIFDAWKSIGYRVIYITIFVSLVMDDLGIPNWKTYFKRWCKRKKIF